eukprot:7949366-Alexandrium_andersonii.AAC.1
MRAMPQSFMFRTAILMCAMPVVLTPSGTCLPEATLLCRPAVIAIMEHRPRDETPPHRASNGSPLSGAKQIRVPLPAVKFEPKRQTTTAAKSPPATPPHLARAVDAASDACDVTKDSN